MIVLWTANTERFCDVREGLNDTADNLLASIKRDEEEVSPSTLFAVASILEGVSQAKCKLIQSLCTQLIGNKCFLSTSGVSRKHLHVSFCCILEFVQLLCYSWSDVEELVVSILRVM